MLNKQTPSSHYAIQEAPPLANTDHIKRKFLDIPYAPLSPSQRLDIYLPNEGDGPFPVIVAIHGGAFMGCDKADMQVLPMLEGLKRGYAVVSINYRMSGEAKFPALVQDAKAAVRWVRAMSLIRKKSWLGEAPLEVIFQRCWAYPPESQNWRT
jgi:acetyl esterase/lipase